MDGDLKRISDQVTKYSNAVAQSVPIDVIRDIAAFVRDAAPTKSYQAYPEVPFWYEVLEKPGWSEKIVSLVDGWASDRNNVERAAEQVRRPANKVGPELVRKFCIFRFKMRTDSKWTCVPEGLGVDDHPQTAVFIALEDLTPDNGFFMRLECGQDVCIDGRDPIYRPPTGGGLGIWMVVAI